MKPNITRDQILAKYWELANVDVVATKGSLAGQLKALDSLSEELRHVPEQRPAKFAIYRSGWMNKTADLSTPLRSGREDQGEEE